MASATATRAKLVRGNGQELASHPSARQRRSAVSIVPANSHNRTRAAGQPATLLRRRLEMQDDNLIIRVVERAGHRVWMIGVGPAGKAGRTVLVPV